LKLVLVGGVLPVSVFSGSRFRSIAADLAFGQPLVNGSTGESGKSAGQFYVRQAACEKIINRANGHTEARGELPFVFVFRLRRLVWRALANGLCIVVCCHAVI
jgi:hypothetical protein